MASEQVSDNSNADLTPATQSVSAWDNAQSLLKDLAGAGVADFTAQQSRKLAEKQLDVSAAAQRSALVNPSYIAAQNGGGMSDQTKKILLYGGIALGVVLVGALLIKVAK